ncbi:MAG TPA: ribosomal protein S18-alanine N-acetyltransferase [Pyrinomonadaceae bacterium]|nr:ribosomal protein S18-alanine N-acetyltransferase [Pyrinomonadaceae bacterium]
MTEHDLLEVVQIEHACALSKWGWDAYYSELANGALMMVARLRYPDWKQNCLIKGFAAARLFSDQMHINNIGVRPEYQRCGIGRALLRAALTTAYRAGARVAHLEVRPSNAGAIALYARHQFRVVGRRPKYYVEPPEDALLMSAEIAG